MRQYGRNPHQTASENITALPGKWAKAIVAIALAMPAPAHAINDSETALPGTPCSVGNESLAYDSASNTFKFSGQITCGNANPTGTLKLNMKDAYQDGSPRFSQNTSCTGCLSLRVDGAATKAKLPDGIHSLRAEARVRLNATSSEVFRLHDSCFLIQGTTVTPLMQGCVSTATQQ